jgi:hypothetical protein
VTWFAQVISQPTKGRLAIGIAPSLLRPFFASTTTPPPQDPFAYDRQDVEDMVDGKSRPRHTQALIECLLFPAMTDANLPPEAEAAAGC